MLFALPLNQAPRAHSPDAHHRRLHPEKRLLIGQLHEVGKLVKYPGALAREPLEDRGTLPPRRFSARSGHRGREALAAVFGGDEMVLDGDCRNELIDDEPSATRMLGKKRVVRRQARVRRQFQITNRACAREHIGRAALMARIEPRDFATADRTLTAPKPDFLKIRVELDAMGVVGDPGRVADQRREAGPDMQVVFKEAGVIGRPAEERSPCELMAFQAGEFEAREAPPRRRRILRAVDGGNALEPYSVQLSTHMGEAIGVAVEVDQVNLQGTPGAQTFICAPSSTTRSDGKLKKSGALAACFVMAMNSRSCHSGMPDLVALLSVRRPKKNDVVMMSNLRAGFSIAASARGIGGCSI